jgi:hypothetical protein
VCGSGVLDDVDTLVMSPALFAQRPIREPADIEGHTLLATETRAGDWVDWLEAAGLRHLAGPPRQIGSRRIERKRFAIARPESLNQINIDGSLKSESDDFGGADGRRVPEQERRARFESVLPYTEARHLKREQRATLLGVSHRSVDRWKAEPLAADPTRDQIERISYASACMAVSTQFSARLRSPTIGSRAQMVILVVVPQRTECWPVTSAISRLFARMSTGGALESNGPIVTRPSTGCFAR